MEMVIQLQNDAVALSRLMARQYRDPHWCGGEPTQPWLLLGVQMAQKLAASASRLGKPPGAKESGIPSCPLRDSGSP